MRWKLGLIKFRYSEGYICKKYYKTASQNFTVQSEKRLWMGFR